VAAASEESLRRQPSKSYANRALNYYYLPQLLRAAPWLGRAIDKGGAREAAHCAHCPPTHLPGLKEAFLARLPDGGAMFAPAVVRYGASGLDTSFHHCPLQRAWLAAGLPGPAAAALCRVAAGGDRGRGRPRASPSTSPPTGSAVRAAAYPAPDRGQTTRERKKLDR
jgi:hypothetical protein